MFHGHREHAEERALLRGEITDKMGVFATVSAGGGTKMALLLEETAPHRRCPLCIFPFFKNKELPKLGVQVVTRADIIADF